MRTYKQVKDELDQYLSLSNLTHVYEDIAVSKMQEIRLNVITTRQLFEDVADIYNLAKAAYLKQIPALASPKTRQEELNFIRKNKKTIVIFLSANQRLLGNIIFQSYKVFADLTSQIFADRLIIGQLGRYLQQVYQPRTSYTYFDLDDYRPTEEQIGQIIDKISLYERILVVYPRFATVFSQIPQVEDISGGSLATESRKTQQANPKSQQDNSKSYFFEPSAKEVMGYFDSQIIKLLFKQTILEAMLARYAARLSSMDQASQTLEKLLAQNTFEQIKIKRNRENKKLLNVFSGMSIWTNTNHTKRNQTHLKNNQNYERKSA